MSKHKSGLYPGTFDPITSGHLDIIKRSTRLVDQLIIGVAINRDKGPLFTLEERVAMVEREVAPLQSDACRIEVRPFEGLLMHYARDNGCDIIVRGLRAVTDFDYEFQLTGMNARIDPDIETVFLMAGEGYQFIASRLVKEVAKLGGPVESYVSKAVADDLRQRLSIEA